MILPDSIAEKGIFLKDQLFDLKGLSLYSALSVSTLRGHIRTNGLPAYQVHGKILVRLSKFDRWLSQFRMNKTQDLNRIADEVIGKIGLPSRRSGNISS